MNQKRVHTPEGVRDIYGLECKKRLRLKDKLNHVFALYGYENIITTTFEFFDIFNSEKGTVSSKEMYKFFDREGNTLVLRPDITPSVARCVAKYYDSEERNLRFAYTGNVFLNNSSYQLKLKETCQMGAELINDPSSHGDGEIIAMALDCCLNAGLKDFRLTIGQVEYFQGLVECIEDEDVKEQLRELIINKNFFGLIEFVESLDIPQAVKDVFVQFNELNGDVDILDKADALVSNETSKRAIRKLRKVYRMLKVYGLEQYISFDLGMLSRHNYYTGVIFKAYTYGTGDAVLKDVYKRQGHGQLDWGLRNDERVVCMERTNMRYVTPEDIEEPAGFVSIDVSFISLTKILPAVYGILENGGEVTALIKPQFEAGREKVGKKGVVRDPAVHEEVIEKITDFASSNGFELLHLDYSPIKGPEGNIEYLLHMKKTEEKQHENNLRDEIPKVVAASHGDLERAK